MYAHSNLTGASGATKLEQERFKLLERLKVLDTILCSKPKAEDENILDTNAESSNAEKAAEKTRKWNRSSASTSHEGFRPENGTGEIQAGTVLGDGYFSLSTMVQGKRKRKPNRRYIEDVDTDNIYFVSDVHRLIVDGNDSSERPNSQHNRSELAGSESDVDYTTEFESPTQKRKSARLAWSSRKRVSNNKAPRKEKMSSSEKEVSSDGDLQDSQSFETDDCEQDFSSQHVETVPTPNGGTRRKHHRPWTLREVMILIEGVARCGGGKWADIKKLEFSSVSYRTAVDLKDKWRNLLRASRVHFTSKQQVSKQQSEQRKKQFAVTIPQPILARVRELAALQNQQPSMQMMPSRNRRMLRRKSM